MSGPMTKDELAAMQRERDLIAEITVLRARVVELEATLKVYAQSYMWRSTSVYMCGHSSQAQIMQDRGAKARAVLKRRPA